MDWSQTSLQPDFLEGVFWGFYSTPEAERNWPAIRAALKRCAAHFEKLDRLLVFVGRRADLADIAIGTPLYRYFELEIERPPLPQVERWYRMLQQRPAFREHVMIPCEELRERLDY
jgi:glutathione S-transferase